MSLLFLNINRVDTTHLNAEGRTQPPGDVRKERADT